ncbi:hypothetical protein AKJ41_00125 [candidate division MSBL1 archaeon SCGC-AAA259O05]|uniref:Uncharacterized protein n=1 Tax=candidate division MSBL1 archaeon SCGC-AAA259O05 TaxID=1698271 RepID=A0A133V5U6_9EURY|nr:hypothetical protein AKJ41_00125 [candidate division MSBL1 archaeon SCGC-AAA259O05]
MARFSRLLSVFLSSPRCSGSSGAPSGSPTTRAFSLRTGSQNSKRQIHTAWLGMESGVQGMLNRVKKGITLGRIRNSVRAANNAGLNAVGSSIPGVPGETEERMKGTVVFAKELGLALARILHLTPCPGTKEFGKGWKGKKRFRDVI